ncbi:hypothetical protein RvY_07677 [Ramazzottius varieornatus]|uniref:Uncharacterized protein n=1 Tax=Ramazzottius varieornatus TaxID=947166 RepID=A0A1D1V619_RAMVA|nr:hypothetical protein RvY_07677 [Ramazzottius varieornatus]
MLADYFAVCPVRQSMRNGELLPSTIDHDSRAMQHHIRASSVACTDSQALSQTLRTANSSYLVNVLSKRIAENPSLWQSKHKRKIPAYRKKLKTEYSSTSKKVKEMLGNDGSP